MSKLVSRGVGDQLTKKFEFEGTIFSLIVPRAIIDLINKLKRIRKK